MLSQVQNWHLAAIFGTSAPDPALPWRAANDSNVMPELIVNAKGTPQDVRIIRSGGKSFAENAVRG